MDFGIFFGIFAAGVCLVALQGIFSLFDGYFSKYQMLMCNKTGWSFLQHGGMWADVFVISPLVAYDASKYSFDFTSWNGIVLIIATIAVTLTLVEVYRRGGMSKGEAHTHDGKTTIAGWIHALFAAAAIWVYGEIYLGLTTPVVSTVDLLLHTALLTPFFDLGARKFTSEWKYDLGAKVQVFGGTAVVWVLTLVRLYLA